MDYSAWKNSGKEGKLDPANNGFGREKKMTHNIHPEISKRSPLKHIGDGLSVAGIEE